MIIAHSWDIGLQQHSLRIIVQVGKISTLSTGMHSLMDAIGI